MFIICIFHYVFMMILYDIMFICIYVYSISYLLIILFIFAIGFVFCNILSFGCWDKQISRLRDIKGFMILIRMSSSTGVVWG